MPQSDRLPPDGSETCGCFVAPSRDLLLEEALGEDDYFADVTLLICPDCGQRWLRYFYELEAFTASGRWYLGAVDADQAARLTAENAGATLESLSWYFYGGSYFSGRSGKTSGVIFR